MSIFFRSWIKRLSKNPQQQFWNVSQLPVDAHEEVGEETFVETQLAALLNVGKADDEEYGHIWGLL